MAFSRFKEWSAYQKGFRLAQEIQKHSRSFPKVELYSLTDQIRRSPRSVCANLGEAYGKRVYPKHFSSKISDAVAENFVTQVWLDFALRFDYLNSEAHQHVQSLSEEVGKLLSYMLKNPERFISRPNS